MKRFIIILSGLLTCLAAFSQDNAGGSWWQNILKEARGAETSKVDSSAIKFEARPAVAKTTIITVEESAAADDTTVDTTFADSIPAAARINMSLILPFNATAEPNYRAFDFYSGVLMAAANVGNEADSVCLSVFDSAAGISQIGKQAILSSDIVMGPFAADDIRRLAERYGRFVISPLEPSGASLTVSSPVIQAPTPWKEQVRELVSWACEDLSETAGIVVVSNSEKNEACRDEVLRQLEGLEARFEEISCASFENLPEIIGNAAAESRETRFILASEDGEFSRRIISVIGTLAEKGRKASTYCTTKARTFSIPAADRGKARLKITAAYFVDDSDPAVKAFEKAYIERFGSRPNSFAYQGYDLANYFFNAYRTYGKDWQCHLEEFSEEGLQTDFAFEVSGIGYENCGIRRVEYNPDGTSRRAR